MTLERPNSSTHKTLYRRLTTGADTVMPGFATGPLTVTNSRYQAPEMAGNGLRRSVYAGLIAWMLLIT